MKQVIRYQCEHCKKEFRTPNRHYCKINPELKNCFTCKHLKGWEDGRCIGEGEYLPHYPDCAADFGEGWDIELMKDKRYNMQCSEWENGKYDWSLEVPDYFQSE